MAASEHSALKYMCWEGYNDEKVITPFQNQYQTKLDIDLIVDSPAGFSSLLAGGESYDVVSIDLPWVKYMAEKGLCHFLDLTDFKHAYSNLYEQFHYPFEPLMQEGKITGIPTRWGWIGPTINTLYTDEKEFQSYAPCFDRKYRGKIGVMDWGDWPIMPVALYAGINPYKELDIYELNEIRKVVKALFNNNPVFFTDPSIAQKALLDGSVKTLIGTGTFLSSSLRKAGFRQIKTVIPKPQNGLKQGIIWLEASTITAKASNKELSINLLKHLTSIEASLHLSLSNYACNLSTNRLVENLYTEDQRSILQLNEVDNAWDNSIFHSLSPSIRKLLALWQEELFLI